MPKGPQPETRPLSGLGQVLAVALVVGFGVFVVALVAMRNDARWDRLVFVFGGYEALVFAGAGALFGTSVKRQEVSEARTRASKEKQRADVAESDANAGRSLQQVILAKRDAQVRAGTGRPGLREARPADAPPSGGQDLDELARLAERLFEPRSGSGPHD
jgi:hypothetical protein